MSKIIVLMGAPGAGKGTQARLLQERRGLPQISTGDIFRALSKSDSPLAEEVRGVLAAGRLVPDELVVRVVEERTSREDCRAGYVLDGFPRTTAQAEGLDQVLEQSGRRVDLVVLFEAPDETIVKRLAGRRSCPQCGAVYNVYFNPPAVEGRCDRCGSPLQQRPDDVPATITRRLEVYREQTSPLVSFYEDGGTAFERIRADRGVDEVYADFKESVEA
jgi:adenylate kinase